MRRRQMMFSRMLKEQKVKQKQTKWKKEKKKKNSYFGSIFFSLSNDFETSPTALEVCWPVSLVQGLTFHV